MLKWDIKAIHEPGKNILHTILENRGIVSLEEKEMFLDPPQISHWFKNLPRELLISLKNARDIVNKAMKENRAILIHGDYDVDGVCATAILYSTLKRELGYKEVYTFIPNRFDHGYGLSMKSIEACLELIPKNLLKKKILLITVDTGVTAVEEVKFLKDDGHEVIITDHHQKPQELPNADCIVWYDQVVGATVSWLLSKILGGKKDEYYAYLALATVTDLQPVLNFNRSLVSEGLRELNSKPPIGLRQLMSVAGRTDVEITSYDLGWVLGPRLNASGRVLDAIHSLNLLLEEDEEKAKELAWSLNQVNSERQDKTLEMYELAADINEDKMPKIIISHDENYHEGIIGLVASRLAQKFYRPAIVISTSDKVAKGSVRSVSGINIIEILREKEELFLSLGGHPMAAGFSIDKDKISQLKEFLHGEVGEKIDNSLLERTLEIDLEVPSDLINLKLIEDLDSLKPFGLGNSSPVFCTKGLNVLSSNFVGKESQHLSLKLDAGNSMLKAIMFNAPKEFLDVKMGDQIDVAYSLNKNEYNGKVSVDLILKDIKKSL